MKVSLHVNKKRVLLFGLPLAVFLALIYPVVPGHELSTCAVFHMLKVNCPGCGLTRAIVALVHGELMDSVAFNPMGIVFGIVFLCLWVRIVLFEYILRRPAKALLTPKGIKIISFAFVAGLFIQWFFYLGLLMVGG